MHKAILWAAVTLSAVPPSIGQQRREVGHLDDPSAPFSATELPKSASGKILKRILRERYWAHQEPAVS